MVYQRKTKDIYRIIWNGEEVDSFDTFEEAKKMKKEYEIAYHDSMRIKRGREPLK